MNPKERHERLPPCAVMLEATLETHGFGVRREDDLGGMERVVARRD